MSEPTEQDARAATIDRPADRAANAAATASTGYRNELIWVCRIVIGMVLIAAGLAKIGNLGAFSREIENFNVLPIGSENLFAIVTPWIELIAGLSLVLGIRARSGAWFAVALMTIFTVGVLQAMARGLDISCGCFGTATVMKVGSRKLIENLVLLGFAVFGAKRMT